MRFSLSALLWPPETPVKSEKQAEEGKKKGEKKEGEEEEEE